MSGQRYPLEPLFAKIGGSFDHTRRQLGLSGGQANAYRAKGCIEETAERLAIRAGFHPFEIWPEMVDDVIDDVEGRPQVQVVHLFVTCVECGRPLELAPGHVEADGTSGHLSAVCRAGHVNHVRVSVEHRGTLGDAENTPELQASAAVLPEASLSTSNVGCHQEQPPRKVAV